MRVLELWRYPVKSLQGERLGAADLGPHGIAGDRGWALFDRDTGMGLTARRAPDLLFATGRLRDDGGVEVVLPDGTVTADDAVLSDWVGRRVELRAAARLEGPPRYEAPDDDEELAAGWHEWEGAAGAFHDNAFFRVSLVSTGTLGTWDRRRFRANVLLDGEGEDALAGRRVRLGTAELAVVAAIPRCVMVTRPQPGGIARDNAVLKTLHRERDGLLAIGAGVVRADTARPGDELRPL
jgi:MOSC domain-containing protein